MTTQTIQFDSVSISEIGSGTITAFLFSGATLVATLASITENGTLKGRYTGTVDDVASGTYRLVVKFNGYSASDPEYQVTLLLAVGTYIAVRLAVLDSATQAQIDAIEASTVGMTGTGARTVTITIDDGTTPLQNAKVRMAEGANTFTSTTDVSGGVVFNLDDATYTVSVTKSGYTYAGTTLVVDGTEAVTYSMTLVAITPPANPGLSALVVLCLDEDGEPEAGVDIDIRIVTVPSGDQNIAYKGSKQTATSDVDGIARLEAVQGSVCEWKRGRSDVWARVTIDGDSSTNVTSIIGSP